MRSFLLVCFLHASKAALIIGSKLEREVAVVWARAKVMVVVSADGKGISDRTEGLMEMV